MIYLTAYLVALALGWAFMAGAGPRCTCPVARARCLLGERCPRHPDWETEIGR